jgi:sec-independent protein translocase protein TatA
MVGDILQPTHLLFILVVALLVLGPKRLPEVGRTLGSGLRDFRQALSGELPEHQDHSDPQWNRNGGDAETEFRHPPQFEPVAEPTAVAEPEPAAETSEPEIAADPAPTASEPELAHQSVPVDAPETQSRTEPGA